MIGGSLVTRGLVGSRKVGGTWGVIGTWTIPAVTLGGTVTGAAQILSNLGQTYIGDTANTNQTLGLTINQGAADNEILAFKSSDVAHSATTLVETDTFGAIKKAAGPSGGLDIWGLADSGATASAIQMVGILASSTQTTKSTAGQGILNFNASQVTGTTFGNVDAGGNILAVRAYMGGAFATQLILDAEGDLWLNGGITTTTVTVGANQVVGAQGAAVADSTDAASVILRLNDLLARCRAHGIIAT
ncbi:MAG: hypothetical protein KJ556_22045 [Gammaproteobacteria bacterium]|nr:hypothetical protein [Gammaproteobacteria bacterium]